MPLDEENHDDPIRPRADYSYDFLDMADFVSFDDHDRSAAHQITQQLAFLGDEKSRKLLNFLVNQRGFAL